MLRFTPGFGRRAWDDPKNNQQVIFECIGFEGDAGFGQSVLKQDYPPIPIIVASIEAERSGSRGITCAFKCRRLPLVAPTANSAGINGCRRRGCGRSDRRRIARGIDVRG